MEKSTEQLLKEQHRNTRHDAIDIIYEVLYNWESEYTRTSEIEELARDLESKIMNLKIRKPKL